MVSVRVLHCEFFKLPKSNLMNANILFLVWFGSGRNKLVQLLIWARDIFSQTIWALKLLAEEDKIFYFLHWF